MLSQRREWASASGEPSRLSTLTGHLAFAIVLASAFLPLHLATPADPGAPFEVASLGAAIANVGAQLTAMLPATVLCAVLLLGNVPRVAVGVGAAWVVAVMLWGGVDRFAHEATGNSAVHYAEYLAEPGAWHWAGGSRGIGSLAAARGGAVLACAVGALVLGAIAARRLRSRTRLAWSIAVAILWAAVLGISFAVSRSAASYATAATRGALADSGDVACARASDPFACGAERLYGRYFSGLSTVAAPSQGPLALTHAPPNIVVIVCDGLRADLLETDVMPRLRQWGERGTRFASHRATANRSDWGMFALVYGMPPLQYAATVQAHVPPTLPSQLKRVGYATHYLGGTAKQRWLMVGRFLARPYFDEVFQPTADDDWQSDRDVIARAREIVAAPGGPRLLVLWLVSTHYPYSAPPSYDALDFPEDGSAIAADQVDLRRNARPLYLRSARFLDDELGAWLEHVDLTRTLVVVTADHGESLYEDGTFAHGSRLSSVQTRVPLLVAGPGVTAGAVVSRPTGHLDLAPTLLTLAGLPTASLTALPGRVLTDAAADVPAYTVAYQPVKEQSRTLREVIGAGQGNEPRQLLLASNTLRVALDLDPTAARVSRAIRLDDAGLPSSLPLTPAEVETALGWLDDHFARSAGQRPAP